jgi:hypothetical protein
MLASLIGQVAWVLTLALSRATKTAVLKRFQQNSIIY